MARFAGLIKDGDREAGPRVGGVLPDPNPDPNQESFFVSKGPRPVAAASKFDPFAKKASSSSTAKGGKRPAAAGGGSKAKKKK